MTNVAGSKTSIVAVVNVGYSPVIVQQPQPFTNNLGTSNAFSVAVFGSEPLLYQWFKDGRAIADATNNLLPLPNLQSNQVGYYSVSVTNLYGWAASSNALLSIPGVPLPFYWQGLVAYYPFNGNANDASGNGNNGVTTGNTVPAPDRFGNPASAYQFDGTLSSIGVTNKVFNIGQSGYTISGWFSSDDVSKSRQTLLNTIPQTGISLTYNHSYAPGYVQSFIGPCGTSWTVLAVHGPKNDYSSQIWYHCTFVKSGPNYTLYINGSMDNQTDVDAALGYNYEVGFVIGALDGGLTELFKGRLDDFRIYNRALSSNEVAQLYDFEADMPAITAQPQNQTVAQGGTATFSVGASAANPLTYQWFKDGVALTGATSTTLALTNIQPNQIGYYSVSVSNAVTGVLSANAALNVSGYDFSQWQGLVAYYPFNGNASDESGNGNNGTVNGAILTQDRLGASNSAYSFNGSSSAITFASLPLTQVDNWTLSAWVSPASLNQAGMAVSVGFDNALYGDGYSFGFEVGDSTWRGLFSGVSWTSSGYSVPDMNRWYHMVMLRQAGTTKFFVDGTQTANTYTVTPRTPTSFTIGAQNGHRFFNGQVDDIRIYNRALSPSEVQQLYASELQGGMWLDAQVTTNGVELSFPSAANLAYSVLYRTNLTSGLWDKLADVPAQSTNSTAQVTDPAVTNSPQRFYRVVTPPWP